MKGTLNLSADQEARLAIVCQGGAVGKAVGEVGGAVAGGWFGREAARGMMGWAVDQGSLPLRPLAPSIISVSFHF